MPDTIPATPVATTEPSQPQPTQPPTPSAAPEAPKAPDTAKLASDLFKLLTTPTDDDGTPKKPEPTAETKPAADEPKPTEEKPKAVTPGEKPIKVRGKPKPQEEQRPPLPKRADVQPPPDAPAASAPVRAAAPAEDDTKFESDLTEEERLLLEDARDAERFGGDKYKDHGAKMLAFLKDVAKKDKLVDAGDLDEQEFRDWHKANLPKISPKDFRAIERLRVKEEVAKEFQPQIEAEKHERWVESEKPKVAAKGTAIYNRLIQSALPDDFAAAIREKTKGVTDIGQFRKAVQEVEADYALEKEVLDNVVKAATDDVEEFQRLTTTNPQTGRALATFDQANPAHNRIVQMVSEVCENFKNSGVPELKQNGRWFVTREEWAALEPAQRGQFWTFTNDEIMERALGNVKAAVAGAVQQRRAEIEGAAKRYGFVRGAKAVIPTPQPPQPGSGAPPAPRPAPPPASGNTPAPTPAQQLASIVIGSPQE